MRWPARAIAVIKGGIDSRPFSWQGGDVEEECSNVGCFGVLDSCYHLDDRDCWRGHLQRDWGLRQWLGCNVGVTQSVAIRGSISIGMKKRDCTGRRMVSLLPSKMCGIASMIGTRTMSPRSMRIRHRLMTRSIATKWTADRGVGLAARPAQGSGFQGGGRPEGDPKAKRCAARRNFVKNTLPTMHWPSGQCKSVVGPPYRYYYLNGRFYLDTAVQ